MISPDSCVFFCEWGEGEGVGVGSFLRGRWAGYVLG